MNRCVMDANVILYRTYLKKRILVQDVGRAGFQTQFYRHTPVFRGCKPGSNPQIGPKDFFEIGSNYSMTRPIELQTR